MNTPDTSTALDLDAIESLVRFGKLDWFCASCGTARDCHASLPHKWMPKDIWALADALEIMTTEMRRLRAENEKFDLDRRVLRDDLLASQMENKRLREAVARVEARMRSDKSGNEAALYAADAYADSSQGVRDIFGSNEDYGRAVGALSVAEKVLVMLNELPRATGDAGEVP